MRGREGPEERRRFPPQLQARDVTHRVCPRSPFSPGRWEAGAPGVPEAELDAHLGETSELWRLFLEGSGVD